MNDLARVEPPLLVRWIWLGLGHVCVLLAVIGALLPVMPTVPFLILATVCYSRGSERFERWLVEHPRFGPPIVNWRRHGVISAKAKWAAVVMLGTTTTVTLFLPQVPHWGKVAMLTVMATVVIFLMSRPSRPPRESSDD